MHLHKYLVLSFATLCLLLTATAEPLTYTDDHLNISIVDELNRKGFDWPRTLVHYDIDFNTNGPAAAELSFYERSSGQRVPYQLSRATDSKGKLNRARLSFFTDLPQGTRRDFQLTSGPVKGDKTKAQSIDSLFEGAEHEDAVTTEDEKEERTVSAGTLTVILPLEGRAGFQAGPLIGLDYDLGPIGLSYFELEDTCDLIDYKVSTLAKGPLFHQYEILYSFDTGATYAAKLTIVLGYTFVELHESMRGFREKGARMVIEWTDFFPSHRYAHKALQDELKLPMGQQVAKKATLSRKGKTWKEKPKLPFLNQLGSFDNGKGIHGPYATFWDVDSGDELGIFSGDLAEWNNGAPMTAKEEELLQIRMLMSTGTGGDELNESDEVLYFSFPLTDGTRGTRIHYNEQTIDPGKSDLPALATPVGQPRTQTYSAYLHAVYGEQSLDQHKTDTRKAAPAK